MLNAPREMLIEKADLEEDTVDDVLRVLKAEFESEEQRTDNPTPDNEEELTQDDATEAAEELPQPEEQETEAAEEKS